MKRILWSRARLELTKNSQLACYKSMIPMARLFLLGGFRYHEALTSEPAAANKQGQAPEESRGEVWAR